MKDFHLILFGILFSFCIGFGQKFSVDIEIKNYNNDTIIIGNYYGDKTLVKDTLFTKGNGKFSWKQDTIPAQGVYLALLKPENSFVQFLINGKGEHIKMKFDAKDLLSISIAGSTENEVFYKYLDFIKEKRVIADTMRSRSERAKAANKTDDEAQKVLGQLDNDVKKYQANIINMYPGTLVGTLMKANTDIELPEFAGHEDTVRYKRYYYYKDHYFDNINPAHPSLIRTPYLHQKIDYYITKLVNQQPDSLLKSLDLVLRWLEPNAEA